MADRKRSALWCWVLSGILVVVYLQGGSGHVARRLLSSYFEVTFAFFNALLTV